MAMNAAFFSCVCACPSTGVRDVVPTSHDVKAHPQAPDGYVYIATKPHATIGLAEARGLSVTDAKTAIDRLADALDKCLAREAPRTKIAPGAARVVAEVDSGGIVGAPRVTLTPGSEAIGLLCLVAPFRMLQFVPADNDAGQRGIALEATWGQ